MMELNYRTYCFFVIVVIVQSSFACFFFDISTCGCQSGRYVKTRGKRAYCHHVTNYQDIFLHATIPEPSVVSMDLTNNGIEEISRDFFPVRIRGAFENILELFLGENSLHYIGPGAFQDFKNLQNLNLSYNHLGRINKEMFTDLTSLQKLILNYNRFPIIPGDTFVNLPSLKRLSLASDYIVCNCLMKDFVSWYQSNRTGQFKLVGNCQLPTNLQGTSLKRLRLKQLQCDVMNDLPYFVIQPSKRQVVFEGDSLSINCEGIDLPDSKVLWSLRSSTYNASTYVYGNATRHESKRIISSNIELKLTTKLAGHWECAIESNFSRKADYVDIMVLSNDAVYCDRVNVDNNYGHFAWVEAISGATVRLNCSQPNPLRSRIRHTAVKSCLSNGSWSVGNYSQCQYVDDVARLIANTLEKFNQSEPVSECASTTSSLLKIKVKGAIGINMIGQLMQSCHAQHVTTDTARMGNALVDLASHAMTSSSALMMASQLDNGSCHTILDVIQQYTEGVLQNVTSFDQTSANLALHGFRLTSSVELSYCNVSSMKSKHLFLLCNISGRLHRNPSWKITQPSIIMLTSSLYKHGITEIYMQIYRNGNLFQSSKSRTINLSEYNLWKAKESKERDIADTFTYTNDVGSGDDLVKELEEHVLVSNVYSVRSNKIQPLNLTVPFTMLFQTTERVYWPPRDNRHYLVLWDGMRWKKTNGLCWFNKTNENQHKSNMSIVGCSIFGVFAIMKNVDDSPDENMPGNPVQPVHPSVYVGGSILSVSLVIVIFTYITFANLVISRDARHMIVNTCLHLLIGVVAFTCGIWRVDHKVICCCTGISLHYASLSVLLWILLSARNVSKEMLIPQQPPSLDPKPQRPMLRFYLLGCGIPIIICGITAAAKIEKYNGDDNRYCWLSWETSLYAFYAPAAFLGIGCVLILLRIIATLNCTPSGEVDTSQRKPKKKLGENEDANEDTPLQRSNSYSGNTLNYHSSINLSLPKEIDNEQGFRTRLRGVSFIFIFFILSWVFAALSVAGPQLQAATSTTVAFEQAVYGKAYGQNYPDGEGRVMDLYVIFSYLFAGFAIITGIFMIHQHVTTRSDVVSNWKYICRKRKKSHSSRASRNSNDINIITNIKTSNEPKRKNTATTSVTEGNTLETVLHTTGTEVTPGDISAEAQVVGSNPSKDNLFIVNSMCSGDEMSSYKERSPTDDRHKNGLRSNKSHTRDSHKMYHTSNHNNAHDWYGNRHGNHYRHHHAKGGSKPIKMTNLQYRPDSSMTEHSFDEAQMNMHLIPVILQPSQPKIDNSVLYRRHQRIRKNLEAKRNRQRKLTVLREYAQDPLTSNDDRDGARQRRLNERIPLLVDQYDKDDSFSENLAINEYKKADMNEKFNNNAQVGVPKYRTLLISSPNRKNEDLKSSPTGDRFAGTSANLATRYKRRKSSQRNDKVDIPDVLKKRKPTSSRRRSSQGNQQSNNNTSSIAQSNVPQPQEPDMPLHGVAKNGLNQENQETAPFQGHKNHSYLTANDILSSPFQVPSRKTSKVESHRDVTNNEKHPDDAISVPAVNQIADLDNNPLSTEHNETSV